RLWPAIVYVGLLAIGIPWYWPSDNHAVILGMPGWVIIAIVVSLGTSIFTAWLLWRMWPEEHSDGRGEPVGGETD
ncbi:MAG: hypothetical protein QF609_06685, partial [Gammaproteobacteria bacterium]|nr:hypothetical protein [Gammaproteobacteria bacterium]